MWPLPTIVLLVATTVSLVMCDNKYYSDGVDLETVLNDDDFNRAMYYTDSRREDDGDETQMFR